MARNVAATIVDNAVGKIEFAYRFLAYTHRGISLLDLTNCTYIFIFLLVRYFVKVDIQYYRPFLTHRTR